MSKSKNHKLLFLFGFFMVFMKAIASLWHFPLAGSMPIIVFIFYVAFKKTPPISSIKKKYLFSLFLLSLYIILLSVISSSQEYGIYKAIFFFVFDFIFPFFAVKVIRYEKDVNSLVEGLILGNIFFLVSSVGFFLHHGIEITRFSRVSLGEGNPIVWAQQLGQGMLLFVWAAIKYKKISLYWICGVSTLLSIVFMFLSGSKGPIVALFITLIIIVLFIFKLKHMIVTFCLLLALVVIVGKWKPYVTGSSSTHEFFSQRYDFTDSGSIESRKKHISVTKGFLDDNGVHVSIFGSGTGNYAFVYSGTSQRLYPHNIFFELYLENGIIGLMLFFTVISFPFIFLNIHKKYIEKSSVLYCVFALFLYSIFCAQFSGDLIANWIIMFFGLLVLCCERPIFKKIGPFCAFKHVGSVKY